MKDSVLEYRDCFAECEAIAQEIIEERRKDQDPSVSLLDDVWEHVDQHEWVIYYYRSHQFLASITGQLLAEAEDMFQDTFGKAESYDDYASKLTCLAMYIWVRGFIEEILGDPE